MNHRRELERLAALENVIDRNSDPSERAPGSSTWKTAVHAPPPMTWPRLHENAASVGREAVASLLE